MSRIKFTNLDFVSPFLSNKSTGIYRKRTLAKCCKKAGCYLIKENGIVVYVGMSQSCVTEALYRHFYEWNDRRGDHIRITYFNKMTLHKYEVVIIITNKDEAPKLEQSLILLLNP